MCGIIGIVGNTDVAERLVDGLRRMEYRGYDSAGVCTVHQGALVRRRARTPWLTGPGIEPADIVIGKIDKNACHSDILISYHDIMSRPIKRAPFAKR